MTLSGNQLAALVHMGVDMISADGKVEDAEKAVLINNLNKFGVGPLDGIAIIKSAHDMKSGDALAILSNMTTEQKKYVAGYLAAIMVSDGDIADSEVKLLSLISILCAFPDMTIKEALEFWATH